MLKQLLSHFSQAASEPLDELWSVMSDDALLSTEASQVEPLLDRYIELMQRMSAAAGDSGLDGLQAISARAIENLLVIKREKRVLTQAESDLLPTLAELLLGYVMSEGDSKAGELLVQHLAQPGWLLPESEAGAAALRALLIETPAMAEEPAAAEPASAPEPLPPEGLQKVDGEMLAMLGKEFSRMDDQLLE